MSAITASSNNLSLNDGHASAAAIEPQQIAQKWIVRFAGKMSLAYSVYLERRALSKMSDDRLRDIGISREDVRRECARSLFDPSSREV